MDEDCSITVRQKRFERSDVRDIREDLAERLRAIDAEMAAARTEYDVARRTLDSEYAVLFEDMSDRQRAVSRILDAESQRMGDAPQRRAPSPPTMKLPLSDYIIHLIGEGNKSKDDIRDAVDRAGYEGAGRTVHTTLLNLVRANRIIEYDGAYRLPNTAVPHPRLRLRLRFPAATEHGLEDEKEARAEEARIEEGSSAEVDEAI